MSKRKLCKALSLLTIFCILSSCIAYGDSPAKKDESVFVTLKADGEAKDIIVSDWLHSDSPGAEIKDKSVLSDIVNIKGEEMPDYKDGYIVWKSDKNDIFYQGTVKKELPLEVKISYKLDGKDIEPNALAGKSGKVEIIAEIINKDAHKREMDGLERPLYTPFTTVIVLNLPDDIFSNVRVNQGEVFSEGSNQIAVFVGFPGMKNNFAQGSKYIDLPDSFVINADVKNFAMGPIMITATPKLPDINVFKDSGKLSQLISGIDELKAAGGQLKDASTKISEGQKKVASSAKELKEGTDRLYAASGSLKDGIDRLSQGAKESASC